MDMFQKRGKRVGYNLIKVSQQKNKQFKITLPKDIAIELGIKKGDVIHFEIDKKVIPTFGGGENKVEKYCIIKKMEMKK